MELVSIVFLTIVIALIQLFATAAAIAAGLITHHNKRLLDGAVGLALALSVVAIFIGQFAAMYQVGIFQMASYIGYGIVFLIFIGTLIVNLLICTVGGYLVGLYLLNSTRIAQYSRVVKNAFGTMPQQS